MILGYYALIALGVALAGVFLLLFLRSGRYPLLLCAAAWLLPIGYESWVLANCTGECNIRVDLLVVFPAEVVVLVPASILAWRSYRRHARRLRDGAGSVGGAELRDRAATGDVTGSSGQARPAVVSTRPGRGRREARASWRSCSAGSSPGTTRS